MTDPPKIAFFGTKYHDVVETPDGSQLPAAGGVAFLSGLYDRVRQHNGANHPAGETVLLTPLQSPGIVRVGAIEWRRASGENPVPRHRIVAFKSGRKDPKDIDVLERETRTRTEGTQALRGDLAARLEGAERLVMHADGLEHHYWGVQGVEASDLSEGPFRVGELRPEQSIIVHIGCSTPKVKKLCACPHPNQHEVAEEVLPFVTPFWKSLARLNLAQLAMIRQRRACGDKTAQRIGRVSVIVPLSAIRRAGAAIPRGLSVESTVEDLTDEFYRFPHLRALSQFAHVYVVFSPAGMVHVDNTQSRPEGWLHFEPNYDEKIRSSWGPRGCVLGRCATLAVELLLAQDPSLAPAGSPAGPPTDARIRSVETAMRWFHAADDIGYPSPALTDGTDYLLDPLVRSFDGSRTERKQNEPSSPAELGGIKRQSLVHVNIPDFVLREPPPGRLQLEKRWRILDDKLQDAPVHRINVAMAIALGGHENVLNVIWHEEDVLTDTDPLKVLLWRTLSVPEYWNPRDRAPDFVTLNHDALPVVPEMHPQPHVIPILGNLKKSFWVVAPVLQVGKIVAVEREEIEQLRAIRNLVDKYIKGELSRWRDSKEPDPPRPLSIAVFGPPGSGKSYGVTQIANSLGITEVDTFNVSQWRSQQDVMACFDKLVFEPSHPRPHLPRLVFFDEFDCSLEGEPLAWLKTFLGPMQDGSFPTIPGKPPRGFVPAVFVFAGGTFPSFERMDPRIAPPNEDLGYQLSDVRKELIRVFSQQKGPDFISRLSGHINIVPLNSAVGNLKHYIRRSLQLRSILKRLGLVGSPEPSSNSSSRSKEPSRRTTDPAPALANSLARVDPAILYAMLTVDEFRHGIRSMEQILRICVPVNDWIHIASLPALAQLNMQVDAEEFYIRVFRGRERHASLSDRSSSELVGEVRAAR